MDGVIRALGYAIITAAGTGLAVVVLLLFVLARNEARLLRGEAAMRLAALLDRPLGRLSTSAVRRCWAHGGMARGQAAGDLVVDRRHRQVTGRDLWLREGAPWADSDSTDGLRAGLAADGELGLATDSDLSALAREALRHQEMRALLAAVRKRMEAPLTGYDTEEHAFCWQARSGTVTAGVTLPDDALSLGGWVRDGRVEHTQYVLTDEKSRQRLAADVCSRLDRAGLLSEAPGGDEKQ